MDVTRHSLYDKIDLNERMNDVSYNVNMISFDTYKIGIVDNKGRDVLFSRLDLSFQSIPESCFQHVYIRMIESPVLNMDSTEKIRQFFGEEESDNRVVLRKHLINKGWYYHKLGKEALEFRLIPQPKKQKDELVCYFWKLANPNEPFYPPSTTYYIDQATFPVNYKALVEFEFERESYEIIHVCKKSVRFSEISDTFLITSLKNRIFSDRLWYSANEIESFEMDDNQEKIDLDIMEFTWVTQQN